MATSSVLPTAEKVSLVRHAIRWCQGGVAGALSCRDGAAVRAVLMPSISVLAGLPLSLAGLLPNRDHNSDLLDGLRDWSGGCAGDADVAGVFAGDPLLPVERISNALLARGIHDVVNLPSVAQHGRSEARVFDEPGIGRAREFEMMHRLASRGLRVSVAVTGSEDLSLALALDPRLVFVVPDFSWLADGQSLGQRLAQTCSVVAAAVRGLSPRPLVIAACDLLSSGNDSLDWIDTADAMVRL